MTACVISIYNAGISKRAIILFVLSVADLGEGPGGAAPSPYFWTKLRPEGPKKCFWRPPPSPLSQGLDPALIISTNVLEATICI